MIMTEWNIEGISDEVIKEMQDDEVTIDDIDYYVRKIAYWSVFSREPEDADEVSERVTDRVLEKFDD